MIKKLAVVLIILTLLIFNLVRFGKLDTVPYGYHVNEYASAVTVQCMAERGCDAELKPWPLFGHMQYGQDKPPTYVYPGILWAKIFGSTVPSLRAFSVFVFLIGVLGLFNLAGRLFGKDYALAVVLAATCSPWAWVLTRIAWESHFAPVFAIWGLYFFWRSRYWWDWALAGLMFVCAMYTYPPARLQIPLMMTTLVFYEWGKRTVRWGSVFSLIAVFVFLSVPLVEGHMHGALSRRFDVLSIFNRDYLYFSGKAGTPSDIAHIFIRNYLLHFKPDFLFVNGGSSYLHSTRHSGILSWLDMTALLILAVFLVLAILRRSWVTNPVIKHRRWILFLLANILIGVIPSALTNQELPHALRIYGSWPFVMLFTGFMWYSAAECLTVFCIVMALLGVLCAGVLAYQYFVIYPIESKDLFGYRVVELVKKLDTAQDWQEFFTYLHRQKYHCLYYMVHRRGMTCKQANDEWWKLEKTSP